MKKFSVIMPSFLGEYRRSAKNRDEKIVRAVNSVLTQEDFELIIVADGCDETVEIITKNFHGNKDIKLFRIDYKKIPGANRSAGSAGRARNAGLQQATGEYAIYLDADDIYLDGYLKSLKAEMDDSSWFWFDDMSYNVKTEQFDRHVCAINVQGGCGTSNVCHKLDMNAWWVEKTTYLHDWIIINQLKAISNNYKRLEVAGYGICHVPGLLDH